MFKFWRSDLTAGFILFLIALPLSIGIAVGSGAPATAGLISAMIGGVVGAYLGAGKLNINGPAAGLIVIVLGAIETLGYPGALAAFFVAGLIQIALGLLKFGRFARSFPSSVIHGMLMAIGIIIFAKQLPTLMGVPSPSKNPFVIFLSFPNMLRNSNLEILGVGLASLIGVLVWPKIAARFRLPVPAPLVAVLIGIGLSECLDLGHEHHVHSLLGGIPLDFDVGPQYLLKISSDIRSAIVFPDFSKLIGMPAITAIITVTLVGSIESLLSSLAVDRLDPEHRDTELNRELWSKGVCNSLAALIGGIPMIAEIVRSSANITNGAKSPLSNFSHGLFIFVFVLLFPQILAEIPLASLAAVLIVVGYRLGSPKQLGHVWHLGWDQFLLFTVTAAVTAGEDLLLGVMFGFLLKLVFCLLGTKGVFGWFRPRFSVQSQSADETKLVFESSAIFLGTGFLLKTLQELKKTKRIVLDFTQSRMVDHTTMEMLEGVRHNFEREGTSLILNFSPSHSSRGSDSTATRILSAT